MVLADGHRVCSPFRSATSAVLERGAAGALVPTPTARGPGRARTAAGSALPSRPIGAARGRYQQNRLQHRAPAASGLTRGVLMRSYFGEVANDNGVSIQRELRRRGPDLPVYWSVQDHSVRCPRAACRSS